MIAILELGLPLVVGLAVAIVRRSVVAAEGITISRPARFVWASAATLAALVSALTLLEPSPTIGRWAELQLLWLAPTLFWSSIAFFISGAANARASAVRTGVRFVIWFAVGTGLSWLASVTIVQWVLLTPRMVSWPWEITLPIGQWVEALLPALTTFHGRMQGWLWNRLLLCLLGAAIFLYACRSTAFARGECHAETSGRTPLWATAAVGTVMLLHGLAWWGATGCRTWRHGLCEGRLEVPVNAQLPDAGSIGVSYMIKPAATATPQGVIVAAIGGPSAASLMKASLFAALGEIGDTHDILISDYRGFGRSHYVACENLEVGPATGDTAAACARRLGSLANQLNARRAADDLEAVRQHLGIERLDLYGESYGTFFAQSYAQLYPQSVRAMILDSALPLHAPAEITFIASQLSGENPLHVFCEQGAECGSNEQLVAAWRAAVGDARGRRGDGPTVVDLAVIHLFSLWPEVDRARRDALLVPPGDRPQALLKLSSTLRERIKRMRTDAMSSLFAIPSVAMPYACNDYSMPFPYTDAPAARELATRQFARSALSANVAPFTWDEINTALRETNGLRVDSFRYEACLYWPYEEATANVYPAAPRTDILVISGSLDTTTSPAMAQQIAQRWPAARILTVDGGDHFVLNGPRATCARSAAVSFLRDPGAYSQSRCRS